MSNTLNATECSLLAEFVRLRAKANAFNSEIGLALAREGAREWKDREFVGLASACFNLSLACRDVEGSYDVYDWARRLAARLAAVAE